MIRLGNLPAAEREAWKRMASQGGVLEKPDWTEAVWPNTREGAAPMPGRPKPGSLHGGYTLRTSYLGQAPFTVADPVDFLDPVVFTSPAVGKNGADLKRSVPLAWKAIPNALGYQLFAVAPKGEKTLIMWTAGPNSSGMSGAPAFPSMAEVKELVAKGMFLPGNTSSCSIPAGVFEGTRGAMAHMVAFGPGQAFEAPGSPNIRVQTRSVGMLTLGGAGFGDG